MSKYCQSSKQILHIAIILWFLYAWGLFGLLAAGCIIIFLNLLKSQGSAKIQAFYVFLGFTISASIALIINIFLANSLTIDQARIGLYGTIICVFLSFYAIVKHHLFNIKIIAAELFTVVLWSVLLIRAFLSDNFQDLSINVGIFITVVFFGVLLVRGVIKEVEQKEKIEKIEKEIEKAYEVEKKANELEKKANEELKNLDRAKNQFLMQVQHDLRTPLTLIRGYCDLLLGGTFGKQSKQTTEVIGKIETVAENKIKDVNNFLDVNQFRLGKKIISLKPGVELNPILQEIFDVLSSTAKSKGIYLKLEKSKEVLAVEADREKLKAALFNIVDNSIKYTPTGGVSIRVESNGFAKVIVSDTGIGISKERIGTLFDTAFERGEDAKKTFASGMGIGLYLSSQIIKAHNGKIWVESDGAGKGSVFYVELPINK